MKRALSLSVLVVLVLATACEQQPQAVRGRSRLDLPVDGESMKGCRRILDGWSSKDPGPDDLDRRLGALRSMFDACPKPDRMRALVEVALEGSPWSLIAGAVVAEGGRMSLTATVLSRVAAAPFKSPPSLPAWMLLWASDDVASALSTVEGLLAGKEPLGTQAGHALMMMLTHRNRPPDLLGSEAVPAATRIERKVWQDLLDRAVPNVRSLVREAVETSFSTRSGSLSGSRLSRTDENLEILLTFGLRMPEAVLFRAAPDSDSRDRLVAALPKDITFETLRRALPITRMIVAPEELIEAGRPR